MQNKISMLLLSFILVIASWCYIRPAAAFLQKKNAQRSNAFFSMVAQPISSSAASEIASSTGNKPLQQQQQQQSRSTAKTQSDDSLLPPPFKRKVQRHYNRKRNASRQTEASVIVPKNIPQLSKLLQESTENNKQQQQAGAATDKNNLPMQQLQQTKKQQAQQQKDRFLPYQAGYYTSLKSQGRIKFAAAYAAKHIAKHERSTYILRSFLQLAPTKCNASNLACAMTLAAKYCTTQSSSSSLRAVLLETVSIVQGLLPSFSARQLCNVAWALAKFYDRDESLLPCEPPYLATSTATSAATASPTTTSTTVVLVGQAETWNLKHDWNENTAMTLAQRFDQVVDEIAATLAHTIQQDPASVKEGEMSMACWAYGILRRRRRPPGWNSIPQVDKIIGQEAKMTSTVNPSSANTAADKPMNNNIQNKKDLVTFEQWESLDTLQQTEAFDADTKSPTDVLLDEIAMALCTSSGPAADVCDSHTLRLQSCRWSELANIAWSFASHGRGSPASRELLLAIAHEAARRLRQGGMEQQPQHLASQSPPPLSRDVAQLIWSLGILQCDDFEFANGLAELVDALAEYMALAEQPVSSFRVSDNRPFVDWSCADLVQLALSLAHSRLDVAPLLRALYAESLDRIVHDTTAAGAAVHGSRVMKEDRKSFYAWEVSILLWSQARLYLKGEDLYDRFVVEASSYVLNDVHDNIGTMQENGIGPQEQANMAWSLAVLEPYESMAVVQLLSKLFAEAAATCEREGVIQLAHAHQLWQAYALLEVDCPEAVKAVPEWFSDYLRDSWQKEKARKKISSARHRSLSKTLDLMGVAHYNEHDEDIDVAIVLKPQASWTHQTGSDHNDDISTTSAAGMKIAVEFDGPNHFTRQRDASTPPRSLGHSVLKYRLLKRQGWTVVRVPFYEFDKIPFWASMERQRYLQRLLKTHGHLRFSEVDVSEYKAPVANRASRFD